MWAFWTDILVAANVGIMVFFTVAVAPTIFMVLPPEWSAAYVRKFFPKYFFFLGLTTAIAAGLAFAGQLAPWLQAALVVCALVFFFNCFWLTPRINLARDNKEAGNFKLLHWASVGLNMAQLFVFIGILLKAGGAL